jgi:hypothetical protein
MAKNVVEVMRKHIAAMDGELEDEKQWYKQEQQMQLRIKDVYGNF